MENINFIFDHDQRLGDLLIQRGILDDEQRTEIAKKVEINETGKATKGTTSALIFPKKR